MRRGQLAAKDGAVKTGTGTRQENLLANDRPSWWISLSNSTLRDQSSDGLDVDQSERGCWGQAWRGALTAALGQTFSIRDVAAEGRGARASANSQRFKRTTEMLPSLLSTKS